MSGGNEYLVVFTTCAELSLAERIANELVLNHLGACVQIIPGIKSYFHWENKIDTAQENLLLIKTSADKYAEIEDRIKNLHGYEVPEIIAVPITAGSGDYLAWIDDNTRTR